MGSSRVNINGGETDHPEAEKKKKSIKEIAEFLDVAKSTVWYILRKTECNLLALVSLGTQKRPGCQKKTTLVDDRRILSMTFRLSKLRAVIACKGLAIKKMKSNILVRLLFVYPITFEHLKFGAFVQKNPYNSYMFNLIFFFNTFN